MNKGRTKQIAIDQRLRRTNVRVDRGHRRASCGMTIRHPVKMEIGKCLEWTVKELSWPIKSERICKFVKNAKALVRLNIDNIIRQILSGETAP
jgi:hypothetical protein